MYQKIFSVLYCRMRFSYETEAHGRMFVSRAHLKIVYYKSTLHKLVRRTFGYGPQFRLKMSYGKLPAYIQLSTHEKCFWYIEWGWVSGSISHSLIMLLYAQDASTLYIHTPCTQTNTFRSTFRTQPASQPNQPSLSVHLSAIGLINFSMLYTHTA